MIDTPRQRGWAQVRTEPAARGGDPDPERVPMYIGTSGHRGCRATLPGQRGRHSRLPSSLPAARPTKASPSKRPETGNCSLLRQVWDRTNATLEAEAQPAPATGSHP